MTQDERNTLETLKEMCISPGWKIFVSYLTEDRQVLNDLNGVKDLEELYHRKGKLSLIDDILSYEDKLDRALDEDN